MDVATEAPAKRHYNLSPEGRENIRRTSQNRGKPKSEIEADVLDFLKLGQAITGRKKEQKQDVARFREIKAKLDKYAESVLGD